jgi:hypothetical protein
MVGIHLIWTNLNPIPLKRCAKSGKNWPCGSGDVENVNRLQKDRQTEDKERSELSA